MLRLQMCKLPLQPGDAEKPEVGGVEERNAQREVDAHEEVLNVVGQDDGYRAANGVRDLRQDPVRVKQDDGAKGERQPTNLEGWVVAVDEAERHAGQHEERPCAAEAYVEPADFVPQGRRGGHVVYRHVK